MKRRIKMERVIKKLICCFIAIIMIVSFMTGCSSKKDVYPRGSINLIIPYSAGGNADTIGRLVAKYLGEELGVQVVCVNKPGSSGEIGALEIANAKPDGYTIGLLNSPDFIISDIVNESFEFDTKSSVNYIAAFTQTPFSYYAKKGSELDSLNKFIEYCKANPGKVTVAEGGIAHRVLAAAIMDKFNIKFTTINFNGASEVVTALLGDHVNAASSGNQQISSYLPKGYIPIAWGGNEKCAEYPDAPLFKDYGLNVDFLAVCNTIVAPKGVPDEILQKLTEACEKVAQNQELIDQIKATGYTYNAVMGEELTKKVYENFDAAKELCEKYSDIIVQNK